MKLSKMPKEELEKMSYEDIAYKILEESKKKMKVNDLFKKVCDLLEMSDTDFENKIADFFELLASDKQFAMLDKGYFDLAIRRKDKMAMVIDDDSEELEDAEVDEETEEETDDIFEEESDDDKPEDDLKDLVVIDVDEDENNM